MAAVYCVVLLMASTTTYSRGCTSSGVSLVLVADEGVIADVMNDTKGEQMSDISTKIYGRLWAAG